MDEDKKHRSQNKTNDDIETRLTILEYQFKEIVIPALKRIEGKQDAAIRQIDTLKYVSTHEFDQYKESAGGRFAEKSEIKNLARLQYWMLGLIGSVFVVGIASFIGLVVKK